MKTQVKRHSLLLNGGGRRHFAGPQYLAMVSFAWLALAEPLRMISLQGQIAAAMSVLIAVSLPVAFLKRVGQPVSKPYLMLFGFLIWTVIVSIFIGSGQSGIQNLTIYVLFVGVFILLFTGSIHVDIMKVLRIARNYAVIGSLPYIIFDILRHHDQSRFIGTGAVPGVASIGLILCVASRRTARMRFLTLLLALAVFMSLSRAYIVFALICIAIPNLYLKSIGAFVRHGLIRLVIVFIIGIILMTEYSPLRDRFLINDGQSIGGFDIGTSGRDNLWGTLWTAISQGNIIMGNGAGRAEDVIRSMFFQITQPHNDYLRLLYDYGVIGLLLWSIGILYVFFIVLRRFLSSFGSDISILHFSAAMGLVLIIVSSFLDNVIIYVFLMVPVAALVGLSLGRERDCSELLNVERGRLS